MFGRNSPFSVSNSHPSSPRERRTAKKKSSPKKKSRKKGKRMDSQRPEDLVNEISFMNAGKKMYTKTSFNSAGSQRSLLRYFDLFKGYQLTKSLEIRTKSAALQLSAEGFYQSCDVEEINDALLTTVEFMLLNELELLFFVEIATSSVDRDCLNVAEYVKRCNDSYLFTKQELTKKPDSFKEMLINLIVLAQLTKEVTNSTEDRKVFLVAMAHHLHRDVARYTEEFVFNWKGPSGKFNLIALNDLHKHLDMQIPSKSRQTPQEFSQNYTLSQEMDVFNEFGELPEKKQKTEDDDVEENFEEDLEVYNGEDFEYLYLDGESNGGMPTFYLK